MRAKSLGTGVVSMLILSVGLDVWACGETPGGTVTTAKNLVVDNTEEGVPIKYPVIIRADGKCTQNGQEVECPSPK